jgi:putative ABC transport system permease protein
MSIWSRLANVFRRDLTSREIDEELTAHIQEAIDRGRDPEEARQAFGSLLMQREASLDIRLLGWLASLRADVVFGWRLIWKGKATSVVAILSLGLAIGSCVSAFRIIDALLLRPLPIREPQRLFVLSREGVGPDGRPRINASVEYPLYQQMRAAAANQAGLLAVSYVNRLDLTYSSDEESEKAYVQYVSGSLFDKFGVRPALGRTLTENDDLKPRAHPVAVLSYDYWTRRFGGDPAVLGHGFHMAGDEYAIVGVAAREFTGTEPGTITDLFLPTMMNSGVSEPNSGWFRTFASLKPNASAEQLRDRLRPIARAYQEELAKGFKGWPQERLRQLLNNQLAIEPAAAGVSGLQEDYRVALLALGILVWLILMIACANLANLMTARASARAREMALRVAIGAGRGRLLQLVLVESAVLAVAGTALGTAFAWWSAPLVVSMINPSDHPVRLVLPADLRVLAFAAALAVAVTILFGLGPALRASAVQPAAVLKGTRATAFRRRLMHTLIAAQVAFCFLVLYDTGLFRATFERLSHQPAGFAADGVINVITRARPPQSVLLWQEVLRQLQSIPCVEAAALANFPPLSGSTEGGFVSVNGGLPGGALVNFLSVSAGWFDAMKIPLLAGKDFGETDASPGLAIVNQTFANVYFNGADPVGRSFDTNRDRGMRCRIVGLVRDSRYASMRGPIPPVVYLPFRSVDAAGQFRKPSGAAFVLRVAGPDPLALAPMLRREIMHARPGFLVSVTVPQTELVEQQTIRERLLALLASFFATVALLLAAIGLYGVLNYSLVERRRDLGIRIAIGAPLPEIVRRATVDGMAMVAAGAVAGIAPALLTARYIESLLYQVKATDTTTFIFPALTLFTVAALASVPAAIAAARIDPVEMLRAE